MKTKSKKGKGHGHPWIVGIIGIIAAIILYINLPKFKLISGTVLLIALSHLVIAGIVLISAYLVSPRKLIYQLFEKRKLRKMKDKFYFGWSFGWMNMFWISACIIMLAAILIYLGNPKLLWLSFIMFLISLNLLIGNFVLRTSKKEEYMTLPFVDLFPRGHDKVLDAGCGSGRTTLALSKVMKSGTITALDRFDSDYIENGGKTLLERNLGIAGISERIEICQGDVTAMEFKNESFDAAISSFMIDHLGNYKSDALREINRVLKPGGRFLLIVFVPNYATFSVMNVLSFSLTSRKGWRDLFKQCNFSLIDEGIINTAAYFLVEKQ
jgi:ubiquinone/menaquinone biosynthesis C-methylase UbiE